MGRSTQDSGSWEFPGGPVVKTPSSSTGDPNLTPGPETRIPPATGQLSLRAEIDKVLMPKQSA